MSVQVSRHCKQCGHKTLHVKQSMSTGIGLLLTILTAGLFLLLWIPYMMLVLPFRPYRCQTCGSGRLT
jgi:DNA-directed RNA polymerase subunit RPC12/RpoP